MPQMNEKLQNCLSAVRARTDFIPDIALVLGSGLGDFADRLGAAVSVDYGELPGFPVSTVEGHRGRFLFGELGGVKLAVMQGRVHYYEGYPMEDVVLPIRLLRLLGARTLFLTNAAGAINRSFAPGDLMLIRGHIASFVPSPLRGENLDALGTRFPDMSEVYDAGLRRAVTEAAASCGVRLTAGVYLQTAGPQYETPEEIEMYARLGADAVGMSTAAEAIAARHAGMRVCGISLLSNMAAGISRHPLSHAEVKETAARSSECFTRLLLAAVPAVAEAARG